MHETPRILILIKIPSRRWDNVTCDHDTAGAATCLNSWKWIKPSFTTPAALELYDFLISRAASTSRAFNTHTRVSLISWHRYACARANECVKDCYYLSQYKLGAQYPLARTSQSFTYTFWSTEASELPHSRGKKRKKERRSRESASTTSFITNLFHPVVEMGHCSLRASKATSMSSTSRCERGIPLSSGRCLYFIFGFHSRTIVNIFK